MATQYSEILCPQVIYVFRILDEDHKGCMKIGMTKLSGDVDVTNLPENSNVLNDIAKKRIDEYTATAAVHYELLHTECSLFFKGTKLGAFDDHQVHEILLRSGIKKKDFPYNDKAKEWFITDLATVLNAIKAAKDGRKSLLASEITTDNSPIELRPEQRNAVDKSVKKFEIPGSRMLWNCKMRFGKTLSALQVIKECRFHRTLIYTHRPVVDDGWHEDFGKIFYDSPNYRYGSKNYGDNIIDLLEGDNDIVCFASLQDLRGSAEVGGNFDKNSEILNMKWDLLIIDEAHEGTQTELGKKVLKKLQRKGTCVLNLSGTPFNIVTDYNPDEIVNWTYVDEQTAKENWNKEHPCDYNPYGGLPRMNMAIYDLNEVFQNYEATSGDVQFNFREFFRTWTGNPAKDHRRMPAGVEKRTFIHDKDIDKFLNLLTKPDSKTNYPFSTPEYCKMFRHTFWVVPGVDAAYALSKKLKHHPVFSQFEIVNVAGEGDDDSDNEESLEAVKTAIGEHPEDTFTITLSCGRLTTGVSIKPWTAVFMLYGATKTKAQGYMQTIFRVQTPAVIGGKRKEECYVFDFAPDRIITAIDETVRAVAYSKGKRLSTQKATITEEEREGFERYLKYCSVIAYDGSCMRPYDVTKLLEHLKRVQIERVVRNGFEDDALYNNEFLMNLDDSNIKELEDIKGIIGKNNAGGKTGDFVVNDQGLDGEEPSGTGKSQRKELTEEEKQAKRELAAKKKKKKDAISILRGISIRIPMLIYGADVKDEEEGVTLQNFTSFVDKESWKEFMPDGITIQKFLALRKYYDPDVFIACGKRIREKARQADELPPLERIYRIEEILSTFRNPDKETVITPWSVVNRHMSDTIGGYDFYDEDHQLMLDEPRYVDKGRPTYRIFEKEDSNVLELNSKSGRYPMYIAYSLYQERLKQWASAGLLGNPNCPTTNEQRAAWDDVVTHNLFVLCKTQMAVKITKRTLVGYRNVPILAKHIPNLIEEIKNNTNGLIRKLRQGKTFWKSTTSNNMIEFDAIVSNPPYQVKDHGNKDIPVYHNFATFANIIDPAYTSIIMLSRWYTSDDMKDFRSVMFDDEHLACLHDFEKASDCFKSVEIKGGICYYLKDRRHKGGFEFYNHNTSPVLVQNRNYKQDNVGILIRDKRIIEIRDKVARLKEDTFDKIVSKNDPFGFDKRQDHSSKRLKIDYKAEPFEDSVSFYYNGWRKDGIGYVAKDSISKNTEWISVPKLLIPKAWGTGNTNTDRLTPFIVDSNSCCTETYLIIKPLALKNELENIISYIHTKFFHFLVGAIKNTQNCMGYTYRFVPLQDFNKSWTDQELYEKYNLSQEEIDYIENSIKPMQ